MNPIVIDIETKAGKPGDAEEWMRRNWSPSDKWAEETIGKRYKEALEKKRTQLALIDTAEVMVIAVERAPGEAQLLHSFGTAPGITPGFGSEKEMLQGFAQWLAMVEMQAGPVTWIGHNIRGFDLPKLRLRMVKHGISLPPALAGAHESVFDIMSEFCRHFSTNRVEMISASDVFDSLGIPNHKQEMDGSKLETLIAEGRFAEILAYAKKDVEAESLCWRKMEGRA